MTATVWKLDASDGELLIETGVTGRAARMGHRLTIAMTRWQASVGWNGDEPAEANLTVEVNSLQVLRGDGGLTPLSGPEKALARSHAVKALDADGFPQIHFGATGIEKSADGYRLLGTLEIRGTTRECVVDLRVEDPGGVWRLSCRTDVRQTEFGVKPYSMLMGAMKVVDTVVVAFSAERAKSPD